MSFELSPDLKKIDEIRKTGTSATELWQFILNSPHLQSAWMENKPQRKIELRMWRFLLTPGIRKFLQRWEQMHPGKNTTNTHWQAIIFNCPQEVREEAVRILGELGQDAVPALIIALKDENKNVRLEAVNRLGSLRVKAKKAIPALKTALQDIYPEVRQKAIWALQEIGVPPHIVISSQ